MILHEFEYHRPRTLDEALSLLAGYGEKASPVAGGTDLLVNMKYRSMLQLVEGAGTSGAKLRAASQVPAMHCPAAVISLRDVPGLAGVRHDGAVVWVGPMTTMAQIAADTGLPHGLLALADAAGIMGSPLIRNRATIGGNLINARPAADTAVAVLALGGALELVSAGGTRTVEARKFFTGPGKSVRRGDELLAGIVLQAQPGEGSAYLRQGTRRQLEIALVGAAAWLKIDPVTGMCADARISLGAVGPTPVLAGGAAKALIGRKPTAEAFAEAAKAARGEARPIDDFRGSAAYRKELAEVLVRRALERAASRAEKGRDL